MPVVGQRVVRAVAVQAALSHHHLLARHIQLLSICIKVLFRQHSYAIKNQLKAPKAPYWGLWDEMPPTRGISCLFAGSSWHKDKEPAADASEMTSDSQIET